MDVITMVTFVGLFSWAYVFRQMNTILYKSTS